MDYSDFSPEDVVRQDDETLVIEGTINGSEAVVEAPIRNLINIGINAQIENISEDQVVSFEADSGRGEFSVSESDGNVVTGVATDGMEDEFKLYIDSDGVAKAILFEIQRDGSFDKFPLGPITSLEVQKRG